MSTHKRDLARITAAHLDAVIAIRNLEAAEREGEAVAIGHAAIEVGRAAADMRDAALSITDAVLSETEAFVERVEAENAAAGLGLFPEPAPVVESQVAPNGAGRA